MCGLTGIALRDLRATPSEDELRAMTRAIAHRGPDDEGLYVRGPLAGGFRRLSIIDVGGGHQPIFNETGDVAIYGNGEIYNFESLRRDLQSRGHVFKTGSDIETLVHLYEERGEGVADDLVGMYAFAILDWRDPAEPKVVLGRDRMGIKPLYYALTERGLYFASEPKAILAAPGFARRLRGPVLLDYLITGYCGGEHSAWDGIERLAPASVLTWSATRGKRVRTYWDLPMTALRAPAAADEILAALDETVRDHLISDVPLGAFLSGGIDSSAVVDSMARASTRRDHDGLAHGLVLCSVGFREGAFDELETARATASRLSAAHHTQILESDPALALEVLPWYFDEPLADPSTVPTYLVSKMAREHVTVALTGDGGDEVFAGYRRYVFDVAENRVRRALGRHGERVLAAVGRRYPKLDWAPRFVRAKSVLENFGSDPCRAYWNSVTQLSREDALAVLAPEVVDALGAHDPYDTFAEHYRRPHIDDPLYRAQYADFKGFLPDQILAKSDRASMAVSLEVRPPLLDHRFVERFVALPTREKVRGGRGKHAFREALRSRLPSKLLDLPKRGFDIPLRDWLRGPLAGTMRDAIETLPERWFARDVLRARLAEHESGRRDHGHLLWSLFVLERWRLRHGATDLAF
ncbi:MAG: asparagine synthase (glutamine-hydrolyzing) [Planctomycetota bacterium]